jgi:rod shape-determining protein MreC
VLHPAKKPAWIVLGIALAFHILLLSLQSNQPGTAFVRVWLLDALVPVEKVVDRAIQGVWGVWNGYIALVGVGRENQRLQGENARLQMELARRDEAVREAERLREFLGLENADLGKTVVARVVGRDPSRSLQTLTIDKGKAHGVRKNSSVMTPDGVVGRVIHLAGRAASVQLITDAQSAIGVLLGEDRLQAVFRGTGGNELQLEYIDDDSNIAVGNELITSGLDQIHPKGVPVAVVTSVGPARGLLKTVFARPRVEVGRLEEVLVVTELPTPPPVEELPDSDL